MSRLDALEAQRSAGSEPSATTVLIGKISKVDLWKSVKVLKPHSATGPDRTPVFKAKDCKSVLTTSLLYLYNFSLTNSTFPER